MLIRVAGGMYGKRKPGVPLRDRGHVPVTTEVAAPALRPAATRPATRHAWATLDPHRDPVPALVVSWHRSASRWQAWVVIVVDDQAVARYVPARHLRPAHTTAPSDCP